MAQVKRRNQHSSQQEKGMEVRGNGGEEDAVSGRGHKFVACLHRQLHIS